MHVNYPGVLLKVCVDSGNLGCLDISNKRPDNAAVVTHGPHLGSKAVGDAEINKIDEIVFLLLRSLHFATRWTNLTLLLERLSVKLILGLLSNRRKVNM